MCFLPALRALDFRSEYKIRVSHGVFLYSRHLLLLEICMEAVINKSFIKNRGILRLEAL